MEDFSTQSSFDSFELNVNTTAQEYLKKTSGWGLFLSIVWFIMLGFGGLFSLIFIVAGSAAMKAAPSNFPFPATALGIVMLLFNVLGWLPAVALFRFSTKIKKSVTEVSTQVMTDAFKQLKMFFTLMGIYVIIGIVTYIGFIIFAISMAATMGSGRY